MIFTGCSFMLLDNRQLNLILNIVIKDKNYHIDRDLTPKSFFEKYCKRNFDDYVCLLDAPDHEMDQKYGLPSQDYIYNGKHIEFLNVGTQELKDAVIASTKKR